MTDLHALARDAAIQAVMLGDPSNPTGAAGSGAPIAQADELVAIVTGAAFRALVTARVGLYLKGHTPENDDLLPVGMLPLRAGKALAAARDRLHQGCCGDSDALGEARALLVEGVALGLAAIERVDRALSVQAAGSAPHTNPAAPAAGAASVARPSTPTGAS